MAAPQFDEPVSLFLRFRSVEHHGHLAAVAAAHEGIGFVGVFQGKTVGDVSVI